MRLFTSGAVCRKLGIHISTLRRWESLGLLTATRDSSGRRIYTEEQIDELAAQRDARAGANAQGSGRPGALPGPRARGENRDGEIQNDSASIDPAPMR